MSESAPINSAHARRVAARLRELSKAVTNLPESRSEFSMRVPAEPDRDADLVLAGAAQMLEDFTAMHAQQAARIAELEGIRPEFPERAPHHNGPDYQIEGVQRYGVRWNGPESPLAVPMDDGYWVPFHLAHARIATLEARLNKIESAEVVAEVEGYSSISGWSVRINPAAGITTGDKLYLRPLAQLAAQAPDGWQLVPKEPTQAMLNSTLDARELWGRLLAAAPKPEPTTAQVPDAMTLGATWAYACALLDKGTDPRKVELPVVLDDLSEMFAAALKPENTP